MTTPIITTPDGTRYVAEVGGVGVLTFAATGNTDRFEIVDTAGREVAIEDSEGYRFTLAGVAPAWQVTSYTPPPTRDPEPWENPMTDMRSATCLGSAWLWSPDREKYDATPDVGIAPLWCGSDEPHGEHSERNEFGGTNHCTGRPTPSPVSGYTPTEAEVRGIYEEWTDDPESFDRFLAAEREKAWAEGHEVGLHHVLWPRDRPENPYTTTTEEAPHD